MNIDEYRAWKAEQKADEKDSTKVEQPVVLEEKKEEIKVEEKKEEVKIPEKIKIGEEEFTIDELQKGYLRHRDYTKKTQELSQKSKEAEEALQFYNVVRSNPALLNEIGTKIPVPKNADPAVRKIMELEQKVYDMQLDAEIMRLERKYSDFDEKEVVRFASERGIVDLEVAYKAINADKRKEEKVDINALKEQIKRDLIKEIEDERKATGTLISTKTSQKQIADREIKISKAEESVALKMFKSAKNPIAEYAKWRDMK